MKRKIIWMVVSCLMALSLVMASCAPAAVEEEEEVVVEEEEKKEEVEEEVVAPTVEKPKYGGVVKYVTGREITSFDQITGHVNSRTQQITNETLMAGDWARGGAGGYGTHETTWGPRTSDPWESRAGRIAESWELPTKMGGETVSVILHIRKGVHWALNPVNPRPAEVLVGGREVTVDDVLFSLKMNRDDKRSHIYRGNPNLRDTIMTSPAPWTIEIQFRWENLYEGIERWPNHVAIVPPEVVAKYGVMSDWKTAVGTGAFILSDYVAGSVATFVRNPNYWMNDPIGPGKGNQLPYLDGIRFLQIFDRSTQLAALRTAKVDQISDNGALILEELVQVRKTAPQLMAAEYELSDNQYGMQMKLDKAPFNDIRVRRALMMATDFEAIKRDLYGGAAQIITFPIQYDVEWDDAFLKLDDPDCPASVKELYSYNPEKARALLAEAGYPSGFETSIFMESPAVDYYSVIAAMWSKVGVDLKLEPRERAVIENLRFDHTFEQMLDGPVSDNPRYFEMRRIYGKSSNDVVQLNDPVVEETYLTTQPLSFFNRAEADRLYREMLKYVLDQAWVIPAVIPSTYTVWWPWIRNYSGELWIGDHNQAWQNFAWIDEELKKSMGY